MAATSGFLLVIAVVIMTPSSKAFFLPEWSSDEEVLTELDQPALVEVPHGAASLAFVFDITGSMYDDLVQVIDGAARILATTLARRDKPLFNYVLVPFHDPEVGPATVTTDPDTFQRHLREMYVQGGGDCPEMSVTAINLALERSLSNSFIYVFTDARAKDYRLTERVLTLIQQKQSQVVFVMTGDCGDTSHPGYKAFEKIASTSSGQIFLLKKSQVNQVLNFVRVAVQSHKVNLVSMDRHLGDDVLLYDLPVDSKLQEFTISISGENPHISILDPQGRVMTSKTGLTTLLELRNALILNVKDPTPGLWTIELSAQGAHTVRVTGLSSLDFVHGFSLKPTLALSDTQQQPTKGIPVSLLLNVTDLELPGRISRVEFIDLHGDVLTEIPTQFYDTRPALYNVSDIVTPAQFFYIKVVGVDREGFDFQRTTPTAISPMEPTAPLVDAEKITRGYYDQTVLVTCHVTSLIPFTVQWYRNAVELGNRLFYSEDSNVTWSVAAASSLSEGYYTCNASNTAGWMSATTYLDVKDPPPTVLKPADVSVIPGDSALFTCVAHSTVDFNMTWLRYNDTLTEYTDLAANAQVYANGSLIVRSATGRLRSASSDGDFYREIATGGCGVSFP